MSARRPAPASSAALRRDAADLQQALALSIAAGWNQTIDDWQVFIDRGRVFAERDEDGVVAATAAVLPFGTVAWVSMVLVRDDRRHHGIASRLVEACLSHIDATGAVAVLDATPAGEPVYGKLGFVAGFGFERWQGRGSATAEAAAEPVTDAVGAVDAMARLDAAAGGLDRRFLLDAFARREATRVWMHDDGFVVSRSGVRATQIGPLVAAGEASAEGLLDRAIDAASGEVFVDVPLRWAKVLRRLADRGFVRQRGFVRMARRAVPPERAGERQFVLAGPEFG